jgi:hypothetical protein
MKTTKILFALSLAIILFAFNSNNANAGTDKTKGAIKYQVNVHVDPTADLPYQMIVYITDQSGRIVDHPQVYVAGTDIYDFEEAGPQTGVRIAQIALNPPVPGIILEFIPDVKKGRFEGGKVYTFNLYLKSPVPIGGAGLIE